jgi:hypothetical protein
MTVAAGIVASGLSFLAPPALATDYTASGTIQNAATTDVSATNLHFRARHCRPSLATQGLDAYAFAIPSTYAVDGATVTFSAPSSVVHDFGAYVYNSDCSVDRKVVTPESFDLTTHLGPGDTYFVVFSETGSNIPVSLTAALPTDTTYYDEGAFLTSAKTGVSATDTEFSASCTLPPTSQGTDGFVFPIPASAAGAGSTVNIKSAPTTATHDFVAAVYSSDCSTVRLIDDTSSTDLSFTAQSTDAYVSVWSATGINLWPELTI